MPYLRRPPHKIRKGACGLPVLCALAALLFLQQAFGAATVFATEGGEGWQAVISEHGAVPAYLVAVDKSKQELAFFERRSPLRLARVFACTTGQAMGDKVVQGDLKTPEGIYFVGHRIASGLDYIKYGNEAYTLNYPNPVDRLRKKTGYGIWIHGRGEPLTPLQTEGCVSMNNEDLTTLGRALAPGTPVALADTLAFRPAPDPLDAEDALTLEQKVRDWAEAWSARSKKYFDLYDASSYSLATESFAAFKAQKERLFKSLPWIRTTVRDIQALKGPGYWVTWFYQDYQAPNLSTRGVRRLYWARDNAGEFKILGMEWQPGLDTSLLLASIDPMPSATDAGPVWPEDALRLAAGNKADNNDDNKAGQELLSENSAKPAVQPPAPAPAPVEAKRDLPRPSPQAFALAEAMRKEAEREQASKKATAAAALPSTALNLPPPLPAQGLAPSADQTTATVPPKVQEAPVQVKEAPVQVEAPERPAQVVPQEAPVQSEAAALAALAESLSERIENWRLAWQAGDLEAYMAFYAPNAVQGARDTAKSIRDQKKRLWARRAPASVRLEDVRVRLDKGLPSADMRQEYADALGGGDVGLKSLVFEQINGEWLIIREDWNALSHETGN